jgi:peptidoglycan/xylan/chitin deacetylase (PgdA/CDA1 family)
MSKAKMKVVQCWDDGVTADRALVDILRKHHAKATFNLNAGLHEAKSKFSWVFKETEVHKLGWDEMKDLFDGFVIANHSLTHPFLEKISIEEARREIIEGRDRLQQFFNQEVSGFAYPFGTFNEAVKQLVSEAGHIYARTTRNVTNPLDSEDLMEFHPNCHFLNPDFWTKYQTAKTNGVFYFWGHSYEMITDAMWLDFEEKIKRISADPDSCWVDVPDLVTKS